MTALILIVAILILAGLAHFCWGRGEYASSEGASFGWGCSCVVFIGGAVFCFFGLISLLPAPEPRKANPNEVEINGYRYTIVTLDGQTYLQGNHGALVPYTPKAEDGR